MNPPPLDALVGALPALPPTTRSFGVTRKQAADRFGLDAATLDALVAAGLPCGERDGAPAYDEGDLHHAGLRLGTAQPYLWGIASAAAALARFGDAAPARVQVRYFVPVPDGAAPRDARYWLPDAPPQDVRVERGTIVAHVEATLRGDWPPFPTVVTEVLEQIGGYDFHWLPRTLRGDLALVRRLRAAECQSAARLAVAECRAVGHEARLVHGLLVAIPYSTVHFWAEVRVGRTWVPADPLLIAILRRFGGLNAEAWGFARSPGVTLLRLGEDVEAALAAERAVPPIMFLTAELR